MKFEANRQLMLEAAKNVAKIMPSNAPVDVLNGILVECNDDTGEVHMTATNYEVSIQQKIHASVEASGAILINARLLVGMMNKLEGEYVTLSVDEQDILKVTGGRCIYKIICLSAKSYPKPIMPFPEESAIMTGICSLAKRTVFVVGKDESKPVLQCVQVKLKNNAVHAAASDGNRMMLVKDAAEHTDEREFLLPGRALRMLASISNDTDVFEVGDIGSEVVFVRGDMIFTIRKMATGNYMDTNALIKNFKTTYTAIADARQIKDTLNLISVTAQAGGINEPVNLVLSDDEISIRCDSDYSNASSAVPANVSKETPETGFYYDGSALIKLFQVVRGKIKIELDARGFMLVKTKNEAYFQAPVRETAKKGNAKAKEPKRAKGAKDVKEIEEVA